MAGKFLFVGAVNEGNDPEGGAIAKNQILTNKLRKEIGKNLVIADTYKDGKFYLRSVRLIFQILFFRNIVFSVSPDALIKISYFNFFLKIKKVIIFVVGGDIHIQLKKYKRLRIFFENSKLIYVETHSLVKELHNVSEKINANYLPNFKKILLVKDIHRCNSEETIRMVFLSRIASNKGIFRAMDLIKYLNKERKFFKTFLLDIYGSLDLNTNEKAEFTERINNDKNISYKGFLDLNSFEGYKKLSEYHFFLFLTDHPGEGFPGVLIDAMIAGVPVIASDWAYNKEILPGSCLIVDLKKCDYPETILNYISRIIHLSDKDYGNIMDGLRNEADKYNIDKLNIIL